MKKILAFEIKKLWSHKILVALFCLFLLVSGVVFHLYEQQQPAYRYIYQGREQYESFLQGELVIDESGFYMADAEKQKLYKENYQTFLEEMESRAQQTILLLANSDNKSYVYSNAEKTCADYYDLMKVEIVTDNCYGVMELAKYDFGIYFVFGFAGVLAYFMFFEERKNGLLLLVKGTKNGHFPLIGAKILVMVIGTTLFTLLQEVLHIVMIEYYYGYGDTSRSIQSIPEFRNCPFAISVGESILALVVVRIWIAVGISIIISMISIIVRNELLAVLVVVAFLVIELVFCQMLSITGHLNFLKCINPFFFWNMLQLLATYLNLNIVGLAVGKGTVALLVSLLVVGVCTFAGASSFHHRHQIRTQSKLDKVILWWRKKTAFLWRNVNLFWFEVYKTLVQQKRIVLVLLIIILCLLKVNTLNEVKYYDNAYEATYNSYLKKISGKVTDESIAFINDEKAYIDDLIYRWENLEDPEGKDYGLNLRLSSEISMKAAATDMMVLQLEKLQEMEGDIYDKYFVNEGEYLDLWSDAVSHGCWWFISASCVIIWLSGVYPADRNHAVFSLVNTTKNGRRKLDIRKNGTVVIGVILFWGMSQLMNLAEIYSLDEFRCLSKPLAEFTSVTLKTNMTIAVFLLLTIMISAIFIIVVTIAAVWFSRKTSNEMITNIVGVGFVGVITFICICFNISISGWLLNLMFI